MLPIRTILHPTDFSDCSRHAGDFAAKVAKDYRARLILLHVIEPAVHSPEIMSIAAGERRENAERELRGIERSYPDLRCDHIVVDGFAAREIVRASSEIGPDLIIVGTHGRTGLRRVVMGSVAEEVIRRAPCPVLTLKPTDVPTVDYEDWIADAMATAERREEQLDTMLDAELLSRSAHSSYAVTVERTLRTTNRWLRDVRMGLGERHCHHAFRVLRAVLHALRNRLSIAHVAMLGAQLPLFLRGVMYEGWDPFSKPDRHKADFVMEVTAELAPEPLEYPEEAIQAVFTALGNHLTRGEVAKLKRALPHGIRELWELRHEKPVGAT
jgi:nucleotide-binding universal stress UspA family protein/uncharacterized protein (DUF2267 family)